MDEPIAYLNGEFIPAGRLSVSPNDLGFMMGVTISERLRTFGGQLFHTGDHLERLFNSLKIIALEIGLQPDELAAVMQRLVVENMAGRSSHDDLGIALFATPGTATDRRPTLGIQAYPLPFGQWVNYYTEGQALAETPIRQVPPSCWPPALKCRSRMHYYLADRLAAQQYPGARAILLDQAGYVSEASTANVVIYRADQGILSPPREQILPGVSLAVLAELAQELGLEFSYRQLRSKDLAAAEEVLLCSTSPCVWPVTHLNGKAVGTGSAGPIFRQLLQAWSQRVNVDIPAQARRFADRR